MIRRTFYCVYATECLILQTKVEKYFYILGLSVNKIHIIEKCAAVHLL